ncbi:GntR family transcriptional regulator [Compostimonas suwonensis]|uniref:GntR family transcriptional regulator n=1 Tax=Compostimonas suwonensis TaxID=1048394 RepID=A0A2M9C0E3_9MICO|nr:GntR family transcriptional regulator [Compostimonas suwonensis]PJJ63813.1 GntR family transcriptional regulator [Compostimonas suwonensis]
MVKRDTVVLSAVTKLRELIEHDHSIGEQLPNEVQLAERLDVSRGSVREALGILSSQGIVHRKWGIGTFVSSPATLNMSVIQSYRERVQTTGRVVELSSASCEPTKAPDVAATALGIEAGSEVWKVRRLFIVDRTPSALHTEYLPMVLRGRPIDPHPMLSIDVDLFELLNRHEHNVVAHTVTDVESVLVPGEEAEVLGLSPGSPVLHAEQVTSAHDGEPLAFGISLQRTDVVRMRITR